MENPLNPNFEGIEKLENVAELSQKSGMHISKINREWRKANPRKQKCDCGGLGYRPMNGSLVCYDCYTKDSRRIQWEGANHETKLKTKTRNVEAKYQEPYSVSGSMHFNL